ncbi:uncharacterized protein LOC114313236 isoform X1 [Camellia sinensis]|uniref:uncharacterized protein LOC114313236 isoform X1 n=1 Tax=Camellia sinensis TaxID=4442 RepID=UPI0010360B4D|nr:uncharacterized protein LOC114313236 isoform X1 [Camellia sinensis]XP_028115396.1 uncharacterized protein LOC114313236 isoform X1 [Camellia sinensis]XP_028115397.1 uncharacterized protein LOC114313236 isoform X1 [Camellia sinensis]XP_028115398.1 uncharacterized protein LOC114313236 isoform X1 [Camellia sinensis]
MEFIYSLFSKWLGHYINLNPNMKNLKRKIKDLSTKVDDVETELRGAEHHPAKRPRKVAQHWCKNVQDMIESMQRLEEEVDGLGQWMFVSRALLGKHVEEKIQDVVELQEQHNFPRGVLIDAPPTSEQFIPTARFFRGSETITARNKGQYLMDDELSNGNHQCWQPLASITNQYRQPCPNSPGSCNHVARSDYTHTSTSQPLSQNPRSQPPSLAPSSSLTTTSLPSSSHPTSVLATFNSTLTSQGNVRGIKEWNTGARMDIQFDSTFHPVGDQDASLNGQLGQIVRNGTKFPSHMEISTQNSCNWELRGPPLTMGQTHFSQVQQDGYNWQLFDKPESLQATQLGYFRTYGGDAPQSAVYKHGVGPSLASQALTMAEITQQVWEKLMQEQASMIVQNTQQICEKLKRELRAELTTHIEQMTN